MSALKYCCYGVHGGCYFEFQQGDYFINEKPWMENSLFLDEDIVNEMNLGRLFCEAIPDFNYYGPTIVTREHWELTKRMSAELSTDVQAVIGEVNDWAQGCFQTETCFSICGV